MKTNIQISFIIISLFFLAACQKNGLGGDATINGHVKHHELPIPNAMVYIKYASKEFPGSDATVYDASTQASVADGNYEFAGLRPGIYYIYAVGYDSTISQVVSGGVAVKIKYGERKETLEVDVPVVE